jgi:hypothetical protein
MIALNFRIGGKIFGLTVRGNRSNCQGERPVKGLGN